MEAIFTEVNWPDEESGPWRVRLGWEVLSRRWECVSFTIDTLPGLPPTAIRAAQLKADFPLGRIMDRSRPILLQELARLAAIGDEEAQALRSTWLRISDKPIADEEWSGLVPFDSVAERHRAIRARQKELEAVRPKGKPGRRPLYTPAHFAKVARVYSDAYASGKPTKAIVDYFHVEPSTAAKWVARCRALGLLGKTEKGKAGGLPPEENE